MQVTQTLAFYSPCIMPSGTARRHYTDIGVISTKRAGGFKLSILPPFSYAFAASLAPAGSAGSAPFQDCYRYCLASDTQWGCNEASGS
jgi:hypothetical protein